MKVPNKRDLQQINFNHSFVIKYDNFMKIYEQCTMEPYPFLVNGSTVLFDNALRFRKNLVKKLV